MKLLLRQRMQVAHQALQALLDHMGIDLRGRNIGVAEQRLHDAQIRAVVQQVAGKGVAQHVRARPAAAPGPRPPRVPSGRARNAAASDVRFRRRRETAISRRRRFSSSRALALPSRRDNRPSPAATPRSAAPAVPCCPCRAPRSCGRRGAPPRAAAPPVRKRASPWRRALPAGNTAASREAAARRRPLAPRVSSLARVSMRSTSDIDSTLGRPRPRFGPDRIAAGSSLRMRSLSRKRNRCRIADSRRATLDDLKPRVSRSAR